MQNRVCTAFRIAAVIVATLLVTVHGGEWTPAAWEKEDTLEIRTVGPKEGEYWFKVWSVVLDGNVYVRLGSKAAERVRANTTAPHLGIRIAGQQFDRVRLVETPDQAEPVNQAMADKYTSDLFIRFFSHPITGRLVPE
jgi:hypothetical protein